MGRPRLAHLPTCATYPGMTTYNPPPMRKCEHLPVWAHELLLALSAVVWGGAFIVLKGALDAMDPGWLLTLRFGAATLILGALFWHRLRDNLDLSHLLAGFVMGLPEGLAFLVQNVGLVGTTPGRNAFLTTTYCVMVPFLGWLLLGRRPGANNVLAAIMALAGVGLISLGEGFSLELSQGDALTLLSALFFALNIIAVGRFGSAHDSITATVVMFGTCALVCLAYAMVAEPLPRLGGLGTDFWWQMSYVVLLSTIAALLIQNMAQRHVEPSKAALILSLESVFAVIFSLLFYGEQVTLRLAAGFALIFGAVLVSELLVAGSKGEGLPA